MLARLLSAAVLGIDPYLVEVEVNVSSGLPSFSVVGLPHGAVREGRDRVMAALGNVGQRVPPKRITVNLAPADVRKDGSAFDLPIAIGLVAATGAIPLEALTDTLLVGELGLDGGVRPIRGAVAFAAACASAGVGTLIVPETNASEAAVSENVRVLAAPSLSAVVDHFAGRANLRERSPHDDGKTSETASGCTVFQGIRGQHAAKRAVEICAAGGHNLLMVGPPGAGKSMLARRLPSLLPPLTFEEALEVTRVHSISGDLDPRNPLIRRRPFRAPHHTVSPAGLVGGGNPPRPGEISLAHRGVLFLDEVPEFGRRALEVLRQPLETGSVTLARARTAVRFPARFVLVAAMNPCPCGHHGDGTEQCTCDPREVDRYRSRISGPLLDRIELRVGVRRVSAEELEGPGDVEDSAAVRARIETARCAQADRYSRSLGTRGQSARSNGELGPEEVARWCGQSDRVRCMLRKAVDQLHLSARGYHRVLRVARTIADLEGAESIVPDHVAEALHFR